MWLCVAYVHLTVRSARSPGKVNDLHPVCCEQVSQDGKSLLDKLQRPLTPGSSDSLTASANYSKAVHHVLDVIHEVLHHQRQLENIWQHRKVRLHQRLQLCVFQQDVQQVGAPPRSSPSCPVRVRALASDCDLMLSHLLCLLTPGWALLPLTFIDLCE